MAAAAKTTSLSELLMSDEREERDTDPAPPPPHSVCSVCGEVVRLVAGMHGAPAIQHAAPVCAHWRAGRAIAIDPDIFERMTNEAT